MENIKIMIKEDNIKITQAIQDQTAVLVERLDAIYSKIPSNPEDPSSIMPGNLNGNSSKLVSNMRTMTSLFN